MGLRIGWAVESRRGNAVRPLLCAGLGWLLRWALAWSRVLSALCLRCSASIRPLDTEAHENRTQRAKHDATHSTAAGAAERKIRSSAML